MYKRLTNCVFVSQMSFNDFLHRCEMLDFDFDPKMVSQGRMHTRDIARLKVCPIRHHPSL